MRFYQRGVQVIVTKGVFRRKAPGFEASGSGPRKSWRTAGEIDLIAGEYVGNLAGYEPVTYRRYQADPWGIRLARSSILHLPNHSPLAKRLARKLPFLSLLFWIASLVIFVAPSNAQRPDKAPRKLVYKENPGYPLTLREAHIGGVVRLELSISAKGSVDSVTPLGGNPVLVEAASAAVRKWKYAPADAESKTQVEFTFDPKH
jgi:TonB family protein